MGVAAEAARIIATEGQHNYHAAKKKAADRIGVSDRLALPSNMEIKEALYRYLDLYGGEAHRENLLALRRTAVQAMRQLAGFNPRLVGSALDGTAGPHTRIALHLTAFDLELNTREAQQILHDRLQPPHGLPLAALRGRQTKLGRNDLPGQQRQWSGCT